MSVRALTALALLACWILSASSLCAAPLALQEEMHRFESSDGSKSFLGVLHGYDPKTKLVSVKIERRIQKFKLELLSEADQKYVIEKGELLAVAKNIDISLDDYTDKYVKKSEKRIEDRVYPSGYEITVSNRSRRTFENIKLEYTVYYGVQGYVEPERTTEKAEGTLECKTLVGQDRVMLRTEPVSIVSGVMEPIIDNKVVRGPDGSSYVEPIVKEPGGRRKDQLIGCSVSVYIDDKLVKTVSDGSILLEQKMQEQ